MEKGKEKKKKLIACDRYINIFYNNLDNYKNLLHVQLNIF